MYMPSKQQLKDSLIKLLKRKRSVVFYAKQLNVSEETIISLKKEIKSDKEGSIKTGLLENIKDNTAEFSGNINGEIHTLKQAIKKAQIDTDIWEVEKWIKNYWGNTTNPYTQIKLWLVKKRPEDTLHKTIINTLKKYKTKHVPISQESVIKNKIFSRPSCLLLSLPDAHLDKKTTDNRTIEDQMNAYEKVVTNLLLRSHYSHNLEEIVFVVGNDFMHTDSFFNTTTKGTPLSSNTSWDDAYEKGFSLLANTINKLKQYSNKVTVILTQGNHSRTKEYYLAHALEVHFKNDKNIIFNRDANKSKVYKYGETLLCFNHGDNLNDKLPMTFATTFYKEWGVCKYKEIILGDKHHNSEKLVRAQGEVAGVRMRILPCISGSDQWHDDNLFVNAIQAGIALVYDKKMGKISEFEYRT